MKALRILHLEDNPDDASLIHLALEQAGVGADIRQVCTRDDFVAALQDFSPHLILADYHIPCFSGLDGLKLRNELAPEVPLIFLTGSLGDELAVTTLLLGATDFVLKDRSARLPEAIRRALRDCEQKQDRLRLDQELAAEHELMRATLDSAQAAIVLLDAGGYIVNVNPSAGRILGHTPASLVGRLFWEAFAAPGCVDEVREEVRTALEWPNSLARESWPMTTTNDRAVMWSSGALAQPTGIARLVLSGLDITEQRQAEKHAHYLGNFDRTTGLPNRQRFLQDLEAYCARHADGRKTLVLILVGLQRLEIIADSDGEDAVAGICNAVAERLRALHDDESVLARVSDSVFAFAAEMPKDSTLDNFATRILDALCAPVEIDSRLQFVPAFGGLARLPEDTQDPPGLLRAAEAALHYAEAESDKRYAFYSPAMSNQARERLQLESELREALAGEDQLIMYYQPQVDLRSGQVIGLEALIRWRHPRLGLLSPAVFIPLAEVSGLMNELGVWVLAAVCRQLVAWEEQGVHAPVVAVNLSASQFAAPGLLADIERTLARYGVDPARLELELTESASMRDPQSSVTLMGQMRERRLKISIDDFGTGYSNLSYLKRFPVNRLKLDQAFVRDIVVDRGDQAISRAIIAMAHQLKLEVVAEGVETEAQRDFLAQAACDVVQGFLLSPPLVAERCLPLMARRFSVPDASPFPS